MKNRIRNHLLGGKAYIWIEKLFHQFSPGNLIFIKCGQPQRPTLENSDFHIYFTSADIYIETIILMLLSTILHHHYSNKSYCKDQITVWGYEKCNIYEYSPSPGSNQFLIIAVSVDNAWAKELSFQVSFEQLHAAALMGYDSLHWQCSENEFQLFTVQFLSVTEA